MALREFTDERGRRWIVWDTYPTLGVTTSGAGWLAFEASDGERRRLLPIPEAPEGWANATDGELCTWCAMGEPAPPTRRLIE